MSTPGFITLLILFSIVIALVVDIAQWPGRIARKRNHPQAAAINALGWLGLLLGLVGWVVAMVWAHVDVESELFGGKKDAGPAKEA